MFFVDRHGKQTQFNPRFRPRLFEIIVRMSISHGLGATPNFVELFCSEQPLNLKAFQHFLGERVGRCSKKLSIPYGILLLPNSS